MVDEQEETEQVVTLEDIVVTTTKALNHSVKSALQSARVGYADGVEHDTRNSLLLVSLLRQLAELRELRG